MVRKVIVLTGFLGSGKTTLLRGVISRLSERSKVKVIINELGEASLDHHLVRQLSEQVRLLGGGCTCCNIREDLVKTLLDELSLEMRGETPTPEYVVIETTGVSDPAPISFTITTDPVLQHHYRIHKIVATLSTIDAFNNLERSIESQKQLMLADLIVLTKVDIKPKDDALIEKIRSLNPAAEIVEAVRGELDPNIFFRARMASTINMHFPSVVTGRSNYLSVIFSGEVDWVVFGVWLSALLHNHGDKILRVKAVINVGGGDFVILNGVQHIIHAPEHFKADPSERSRLIMVTKDIDPLVVLKSFQIFHRRLGEPPLGEYVVEGGSVHG
jgi:G3E family GTPase